MMNFKKICVVVGLLLLSHVLTAQDLSQLELNEAAISRLDSSEFMLRKAYEQLASVLTGDRVELLSQSQSRWLEYRNANVEVSTSRYKGGSIRPRIHAQLMTEMNETRIAELTKMHLNEITP